MSDFVNDVARSMAFLSRLPVPDRYFENYDGRLSRAVRAFPIAGVLISLPAAACLVVLSWLGADALWAAFVSLAVQTMVTGALHDDGLTDTADGLGGGRDRDHALAIMKDSRIGSYGGVALILSFALRATALAALFRLIGPLQIGLSFLAIAAIARMGLVWHWTLLPPAKKDGVASSVGEPESDAAFAAYVTGALVALSVLLFSVPFKAIIFCGLAVAFVVYSFSRYVRYRIGGHTGDTLGASLQLAEITAVSALALLA